MKLIEQSIEILTQIPADLNERIELVGRVCYKSEDKITPGSASKFVENLIRNGHESVLEHFGMTVRFITDRGVSHEIVRHRLASYSQESTRYCNYGNRDIEFINTNTGRARAFVIAELEYKKALEEGIAPQIARAFLPNALKTEIIMTANFREWRHFFRLRTSPKAHPQMMELAVNLLWYCHNMNGQLFADIPLTSANVVRNICVREKFFGEGK